MFVPHLKFEVTSLKSTGITVSMLRMFGQCHSTETGRLFGRMSLFRHDAPNKSLDSTGFCTWVLPFGFSVLMISPPVSQLDVRTLHFSEQTSMSTSQPQPPDEINTLKAQLGLHQTIITSLKAQHEAAMTELLRRINRSENKLARLIRLKSR